MYVAIWQHNDSEKPVVFDSFNKAMDNVFLGCVFEETPTKPWRYEIFSQINGDPDWVVYLVDAEY